MTGLAKFDLEVAFAYIEGEASVAAARRLMERIRKRLASLADFPMSGTLVEKYLRRLRRVPVAGFNIFYRPMHYGIEVSRVLHHSINADEVFRKQRKSTRRKNRGRRGGGDTPVRIEPR